MPPPSQWERAGYDPRKRGRRPGPQLNVAVRMEDKPEPKGEHALLLPVARDMLKRANKGEPVGLKLPGLLRHRAARLLATYGDDEDERLALPWLPEKERRVLRAVRKKRKQTT